MKTLCPICKQLQSGVEKVLKPGKRQFSCNNCGCKFTRHVIYIEQRAAFDWSPRIGSLIKARRLEEGFTQQEVADFIGMSSAYVSVLEKGRRQPSEDVKWGILNVFEIYNDEDLKKALEKFSQTQKV